MKNHPLLLTRAEALQYTTFLSPRADDFCSADLPSNAAGWNTDLRLSIALRHRLVSEHEVMQSTAGEKIFGTCNREAMLERIYWRGYLESHPKIWQDFQTAREAGKNSSEYQAVVEGRTGVSLMDFFAADLVETGCLPKQARVWFASFWIHACGLRWELGADFMLQHMLDGDPAEEVLTWRWVAGLHEDSPPFLLSLKRLLRECPDELLARHQQGLEVFNHVRPSHVEKEGSLHTGFPVIRTSVRNSDGRIGIWLPENDLSPETSPLKNINACAVSLSRTNDMWITQRYSKGRRRAVNFALRDAAVRANQWWETPTQILSGGNQVEKVIAWAQSRRLDKVAFLHTFVGPLAELSDQVERRLRTSKIECRRLIRPEDLLLMLPASGSFGEFRRTVGPLIAGGVAKASIASQT